MKRIGVLTGGGDAAGMNAAIRAVVRTIWHHECEAVGIRRGWQGLAEADGEVMGPGSVSGILHRGGTILRTFRYPEFATDEGTAPVGKALNLSPNEIAALAGIWVIDETEADVFSFRVRNALDRVRTLLLDLDEHAQDEIASIMLGIVAAEVDRRKTLENHEVDNAILPAWLRGRR